MSIIGPVKAVVMYGGNSYSNSNNKIKGFVSIGFNF
jgi:hypothetical protein